MLQRNNEIINASYRFDICEIDQPFALSLFRKLHFSPFLNRFQRFKRFYFAFISPHLMLFVITGKNTNLNTTAFVVRHSKLHINFETEGGVSIGGEFDLSMVWMLEFRTLTLQRDIDAIIGSYRTIYNSPTSIIKWQIRQRKRQTLTGKET